MPLRHQPAPPTPWEHDQDEPRIPASAYAHPQCSLIGDGQLGENVIIAPNTSICADEGAPFYVGANTNIQKEQSPTGFEIGSLSDFWPLTRWGVRGQTPEASEALIPDF